MNRNEDQFSPRGSLGTQPKQPINSTMIALLPSLLTIPASRQGRSASALAVIAVSVCVSLSSGCAVRRDLNLSYEVNRAPALSAISPTQITLLLIDQRPAKEQDRVGKVAKVIYVVRDGVLPLLESALRTEFVNAGHTIAERGTQGTKAVVQVELRRFWVGARSTGGGFTVERYIEIDSWVTVTPAADASKTRSFQVNTRRSINWPMGGPTGFPGVASPGFSTFVATLTSHPDLIEVIK